MKKIPLLIAVIAILILGAVVFASCDAMEDGLIGDDMLTGGSGALENGTHAPDDSDIVVTGSDGVIGDEPTEGETTEETTEEETTEEETTEEETTQSKTCQTMHRVVMYAPIEPTCETDGKTSWLQCLDCGMIEKEPKVVPALGHTEGEWQDKAAQSCTKDGLRIMTCTVCGEELDRETLPATGHLYSEWQTIVEPTQRTEGEKYRYCTYCGGGQYESIPMLEHTTHEVEVICATEPTCTSEGQTAWERCAVCGEVLTEPETVPMLGHTEGKTRVKVEATCTSEGVLEHLCRDCGYVMREEPIEQVWHTMGDWENVTEPTCTEAGLRVYYCTICGGIAYEEELDAFGHQTMWYSDDESTCTTHGTRYYYCYKCGDLVRTEELPLAEHQYYRLLTPPTPQTDGYVTYYCDHCAYSYRDHEFAYGAYSAGLAYSANGDGTCTITGRGTCTDSLIYVPREIDGHAVVAIGEAAFMDEYGLHFVVLSDTVKTLGLQAFWYSSLEDIYIPDSVETIDVAALAGTHLTYVTLPDSVKALARTVFAYSLVREVTLPSGLTKVESWMFRDCIYLEHVDLPEGVEILGEEMFYNCQSLSAITLPETLTSIDKGAFLYCYSLDDVVIPTSVTSITEWTFGHCTSLTDVTLHDGVTSIGEYAFYHCASMTRMEIPNGVTSIGQSAFETSYSLMNVTLPDHPVFIGSNAFRETALYNTPSAWENGGLYIGVHLIAVDPEWTETFTVKAGTVDMAEAAFAGCVGIRRVILPDGMVIISKNAFWSCDNLVYVWIPSSVTSIGSYAFYHCGEDEMLVIEYLGSSEQWYAIEKGKNCVPYNGNYDLICFLDD